MINKWVSLNTLCNNIWYGQQLVVKDETNGNIYTMSNSQLESVAYEHLRNRWVRSIGADAGKIIITII